MNEKEKDRLDQRLYHIETLLQLIFQRLGGLEDELPWVIEEKKKPQLNLERKQRALDRVGEEINRLRSSYKRISFTDIFRKWEASPQGSWPSWDDAGIRVSDEGQGDLKAIVEMLIASGKVQGKLETGSI